MVQFPIPSQREAMFDCLYFCDLNVDQWLDTVIQVCGRQDFQFEEFFFFYEKEIQVPNIKLDSRTQKRITEVRAAEIYSISA